MHLFLDIVYLLVESANSHIVVSKQIRLYMCEYSHRIDRDEHVFFCYFSFELLLTPFVQISMIIDVYVHLVLKLVNMPMMQSNAMELIHQ